MIAFVLVLLLTLGIGLLFVEIFLLPGGGIIGALGVILLVGADYIAFAYFGKRVGYWVLGGTVVVTIYSIFYGFKKLQGGDWSVKNQLTGRVRAMPDKSLVVGSTGTAMTDLRPGGKAVLEGKRVEVFSTGNYIIKDTPLKVVKITGEKILVEPA